VHAAIPRHGQRRVHATQDCRPEKIARLGIEDVEPRPRHLGIARAEEIQQRIRIDDEAEVHRIVVDDDRDVAHLEARITRCVRQAA